MHNVSKIVIIGGCGHVGLPFGMVLASRGFDVTLLDLDEPKVNLVNRGIMPFREAGADTLLRKLAGKSLAATTHPECLRAFPHPPPCGYCGQSGGPDATRGYGMGPVIWPARPFNLEPRLGGGRDDSLLL